jgi:hypothetical protein
MSILTQEQALSILGLFGGQYPWNDVSGYLLALEGMGLYSPAGLEVTPSQPDTASNPAGPPVATDSTPTVDAAAEPVAAAVTDTTEPVPGQGA